MSISRIFLSLILIFVEPLGAAFYAIYVICGLSDIMDGFIARKSGTASSFGGKLDSIADMVMVGVFFIVLYPIVNPPIKIVIWIISIATIRFISMLIVLKKYKTFAILHTYGNKATGMILFVFPILLPYMNGLVLMYTICVVAILSAIEELIIHVTSNQLQLNRKCISYKIKKNRAIASIVMLLAVFAACWVYNDEYSIKDKDVSIEKAIMEFTTPFENNRGVKNPIIIDRIQVDDKLLVFYGDRDVDGLFGFTPLHRGLNGKYQIRSTNYGGANFYIMGYGFTTSKGNYIAVGGSGYSKRISSYKGFPGFLTEDEAALFNDNVDGNTFLNIYKVDRESNFPTIKIYDANGIDISRALWNDFNHVPRAGVGKAELFMLNVFMFIILSMGFIISKYFWEKERQKGE
ncbi:MAG: CDP-alcohol phosphatidyltransferase family protein [Thermotaleaceae bacterium]